MRIPVCTSSVPYGSADPRLLCCWKTCWRENNGERICCLRTAWRIRFEQAELDQGWIYHGCEFTNMEYKNLRFVLFVKCILVCRAL